jgi:hypothetical protein
LVCRRQSSRFFSVNLKIFLDYLLHEGPKYGYFVKLTKTVLIVKTDPGLQLLAKVLIGNYGIQIRDGARDLGGALSTTDFVSKFLGDKVGEWSAMIETLATIAMTQPLAAYAGFTHGLRSQWAFLREFFPALR